MKMKIISDLKFRSQSYRHSPPVPRSPKEIQYKYRYILSSIEDARTSNVATSCFERRESINSKQYLQKMSSDQLTCRGKEGRRESTAPTSLHHASISRKTESKKLITKSISKKYLAYARPHRNPTLSPPSLRLARAWATLGSEDSSGWYRSRRMGLATLRITRVHV